MISKSFWPMCREWNGAEEEGKKKGRNVKEGRKKRMCHCVSIDSGQTPEKEVKPDSYCAFEDVNIKDL